MIYKNLESFIIFTYWKTAWNVDFPHQVVIDLGKVEEIKGLRYLPRMEENTPGAIKDFKLYIKESEFKVDGRE